MALAQLALRHHSDHRIYGICLTYVINVVRRPGDRVVREVRETLQGQHATRKKKSLGIGDRQEVH